MEYYRRRPPVQTAPAQPNLTPNAAVENAGRLLRRLLPFPSSLDDASFLETPLVQMTRRLAPQSLVTDAVAPVAGQQAATIVSEAAAILDEEMAKGVLAARGANRSSYSRESDQSSTVLRQLHDVIDNIASIWPSMPVGSAQWPVASVAPANSGDEEGLPNLTPASVLRPGQRGTVSMMLCNNEERPVRLTVISTDLISSTGGRISSQLFQFVPAEVNLEPGEQKEAQGWITVPVESAVGCYFGLWVVTGVDYLRALITVHVG